MKKVMNDPSAFVDDSLEGIVEAHPTEYKLCETSNRSLVRATGPVPGKVAIVTGGGYGHLPVFLGYVGEGLCDACAVGNVFTSPSFEAIVECAKASDSGNGVLFLFGNYMGDSMNFEMASEMLEMDDIETRIVKCSDDLASLPRDQWQERRGVGGIALVYKLVGAYAAEGHSLDEVATFAEGVCENVSTLGFALSSCQIPGEAKPIFEIGDDELELGMGIHGEPGIERVSMMTSAELADTIVSRLVEDQALSAGDDVAVMVNSLGATCKEELYILYRDVAKLFKAEGITISKALVGSYAASMEMAGASVSVLNLKEGYADLLAAPARSPMAWF